MENTLTIEIKDKKASDILKKLASSKLIEIIYKTKIDWTPNKKKQSKDLLSALNAAKLQATGKIKLQTAKSLLDEL
jgi:hypothetical protein